MSKIGTFNIHQNYFLISDILFGLLCNSFPVNGTVSSFSIPNHNAFHGNYPLNYIYVSTSFFTPLLHDVVASLFTVDQLYFSDIP